MTTRICPECGEEIRNVLERRNTSGAEWCYTDFDGEYIEFCDSETYGSDHDGYECPRCNEEINLEDLQRPEDNPRRTINRTRNRIWKSRDMNYYFKKDEARQEIPGFY